MSNHHSQSIRHPLDASPARKANESNKPRRRGRLRFERLEARLCLAAELAVDDPLQAPINWFASYDHVARQSLSSLDQVDQLLPIVSRPDPTGHRRMARSADRRSG